MGMTIPGELDYVLDLLGYEWPNLDEDAIREAAVLMRGLRDDLQGTLDDLDNTINVELAEAFTSKTATAYIDAWTDNRTQNMDQMLDLMPTVADGIDIFADAVLALKVKVIAELTITAAQIAAAAASAVVTLGASVAANAAIIAARKKALDIATDLAMEQLLGQILTLVIEPLTDTAAGLAEAVVAAPITSSGSETSSFDASYDLMEQLAQAIDDCGVEQEERIDTFISQVMGLPIFAS
ncbi:hypothetical protein IM660_18245 [Ruania alkalisoli]|uniref:Outer membrane channel protein CpnT-like N-terminal domain-containing protein n=1 Tax=Ruania alkalisoli TaxID=2779775 RepID=A0A7M1SV59_9MICO|nr:hypothetical protein [Ruania alkalisoli]QOR70503.1 hypothetical protein IM660_18245 [Ruania alkalisoli]